MQKYEKQLIIFEKDSWDTLESICYAYWLFI